MPRIIPTPEGDVYNPTQCQYLDWLSPGSFRCFWNWDQAPKGTWELQLSPDLVHWENTGRMQINGGPCCVTFDEAPARGFARIIRRV